MIRMGFWVGILSFVVNLQGFSQENRENHWGISLGAHRPVLQFHDRQYLDLAAGYDRIGLNMGVLYHRNLSERMAIEGGGGDPPT